MFRSWRRGARPTSFPARIRSSSAVRARSPRAARTSRCRIAISCSRRRAAGLRDHRLCAGQTGARSPQSRRRYRRGGAHKAGAPHSDAGRAPTPAVSCARCCAQTDSVQPDRSCWDRRCADWKTRYPVVTAEHREAEGRVSIYHLAEVIGQETSPDDLMVSGSSGSGIEIFLLACPTRTGQRIYHTAGLGAMGMGSADRASGSVWLRGRRRGPSASMATAAFSSTSRNWKPFARSICRSSSSC